MVGAQSRFSRRGRGLGVGGGGLEPTTDGDRVRYWWAQWPDAGIVALAGEAFDAVTLPVTVGRNVLDRLIERRAWLGASMSDDDTMTLLVASGQRRHWAALLSDRGPGYAHAGAGQLVVLPPCGPNNAAAVRWVIPPTAANVPRLPTIDDLDELIGSRPRRRRGLRTGSSRRRGPR